MELTNRARAYLESLPRQEAETSPSGIAERLRSSGLPVFDTVVEFQRKFGGVIETFGLNTFVWGIFHATPDPDSGFKPNQPNAWRDSDGWYFTCADCHRSDHWFLDQNGALHWCFTPPLASSFQIKVERDALCWDLQRTESLRLLRFSVPPSLVIERLLPRMMDFCVPEASDQFEQLYFGSGLYLAVKDDKLMAYATSGFKAESLQDLPFQIQAE